MKLPVIETCLLTPAFHHQDLINEFTDHLVKFSFKDLFNLLDDDADLLTLVIVRAAIKAKESKLPFSLTIETATQKVATMMNTRRKLFVRRIFKKVPLFALQYIKERYPFYSDTDLIADLKKRDKKKCSFKTKKSKEDFRTSQLKKLKDVIKYELTESKAYHKACTTIALMLQAQKRKERITLTVRLQGEPFHYYFNWNTLERVIKKFHAIANQPGMTHSELEKIQSDLVVSTMYAKV